MALYFDSKKFINGFDLSKVLMEISTPPQKIDLSFSAFLQVFQTSRILRALGFKNVQILDGGYSKWESDKEIDEFYKKDQFQL